MNFRLALSAVWLASLLIPSVSPCLAQSVLNQSPDDLLKGFDVSPSTMQKFQPRPTTFKAGMLLKLLETAMPSVDIGTANDGTAIKVKAPFVKVDVAGNGQQSIKVKAPFVNLDTHSGLVLNAPFVKLNQQPSSQLWGTANREADDPAANATGSDAGRTPPRENQSTESGIDSSNGEKHPEND